MMVGNYKKLNNDKCHLIISCHNSEGIWAKIDQTKIWESKNQKLLGVLIDRRSALNIQQKWQTFYA